MVITGIAGRFGTGILVWALAALAGERLVVPAADIAFCRTELVDRYRLDKIGAVIAGGAERQDSVRNPITRADAARPTPDDAPSRAADESLEAYRLRSYQALATAEELEMQFLVQKARALRVLAVRYS